MVCPRLGGLFKSFRFKKKEILPLTVLWVDLEGLLPVQSVGRRTELPPGHLEQPELQQEAGQGWLWGQEMGVDIGHQGLPPTRVS